MEENMYYVATVKGPTTSTDPIIKDVTKKLNKEPNLTISKLINYLIKDDGTFNKEEKEIMNYIKSDMQKCKEPGCYRRRLSIKVLNEFGEYRGFPTDSYEGIRELIDITEIAKNYFEPRKLDGTSYKGLDMEVYSSPRCSC